MINDKNNELEFDALDYELGFEKLTKELGSLSKKQSDDDIYELELVDSFSTKSQPDFFKPKLKSQQMASADNSQDITNDLFDTKINLESQNVTDNLFPLELLDESDNSLLNDNDEVSSIELPANDNQVTDFQASLASNSDAYLEMDHFFEQSSDFQQSPVETTLVEEILPASNKKLNDEKESIPASPPLALDKNFLLDFNYNIQLDLGKLKMAGQDIMKLHPGFVVELNQSIDDHINLILDDKTIAKAEFIKINNKQLGLRIVEIIK